MESNLSSFSEGTLRKLIAWNSLEIADRRDNYLETTLTDQDPNIVQSSKSCRVVFDGCRFSIEIFRLEFEDRWTLEVVDHEGTSHVWDETFASDTEASEEAVRTLESEGAVAFMRGNNVVPFRRK